MRAISTTFLAILGFICLGFVAFIKLSQLYSAPSYVYPVFLKNETGATVFYKFDIADRPYGLTETIELSHNEGSGSFRVPQPLDEFRLVISDTAKFQRCGDRVCCSEKQLNCIETVNLVDLLPVSIKVTLRKETDRFEIIYVN